MLAIRLANEDDLLTYFEWANDKDVRANAINQDPILLEIHTKWFLSRIQNQKEHLLYILHFDGKPIGQVRLDLDGDYLLIDYSIDVKQRGKGYGTKALDLAINTAKESLNEFDGYKALVKEGNIGSARVFKMLGFKEVDDTDVNGNIYLTFQKKR